MHYSRCCCCCCCRYSAHCCCSSCCSCCCRCYCCCCFSLNISIKDSATCVRGAHFKSISHMQPPFVGFDLPALLPLSHSPLLHLSSLLHLILTHSHIWPSSKVNDWVSSLMCLGINCMQILLLFAFSGGFCCFFLPSLPQHKLQLKCQFHFLPFSLRYPPFLCPKWDQ